MKIYISGKITGQDPEFVKAKFEKAEMFLKAQGMSPVNPLKLKIESCAEWRDFMKVDIVALMGCEAIFLLQDWKHSPGAILEKHIADSLKYYTLHENEKFYKAI